MNFLVNIINPSAAYYKNRVCRSTLFWTYTVTNKYTHVKRLAQKKEKIKK